MLGGPQNAAKLQAERKMMGYIVSTPPARGQVRSAGVFALNLAAVEALATKKEQFLGVWGCLFATPIARHNITSIAL